MARRQDQSVPRGRGVEILWRRTAIAETFGEDVQDQLDHELGRRQSGHRFPIGERNMVDVGRILGGGAVKVDRLARHPLQERGPGGDHAGQGGVGRRHVEQHRGQAIRHIGAEVRQRPLGRRRQGEPMGDHGYAGVYVGTLEDAGGEDSHGIGPPGSAKSRLMVSGDAPQRDGKRAQNPCMGQAREVHLRLAQTTKRLRP